jgi:uncharacterized protein (TIGR02466 family)
VEITSIFSVPLCEHYYDDDLRDLEEECIRRSTLDSGRIATNTGWQSNNIFSDDDFFSDFILEIEEQANRFAKELEICQKVKLNNSWININGYKDFNRRHTHQNSIISGVFYIKVPDKSSRLRFYHPAFHLMVRDWNVDIKYNEYTSDIWNIIPEEGKLVLFPSWLEHEVDQNLSQEKRISISFNLVGES